MMLCKDALELVEPIAAGDIQLSDAARAHFESCPRCAGALASARRVEMLLMAVETPAAPAAFTQSVMQRLRRERWRSEQHVDRLFNVAIVVAVCVMVGGIAAMLNLNALLSVTGTAWTVTKTGLRDIVRDAAPTLATYVAAGGLLGSAVIMWWWAERRWQY